MSILLDHYVCVEVVRPFFKQLSFFLQGARHWGHLIFIPKMSKLLFTTSSSSGRFEPLKPAGWSTRYVNVGSTGTSSIYHWSGLWENSHTSSTEKKKHTHIASCRCSLNQGIEYIYHKPKCEIGVLFTQTSTWSSVDPNLANWSSTLYQALPSLYP